MPRRLIAILLVAVFALLGSGALRHWHDAAHAAEDARALAATCHPGDGQPEGGHVPPTHDALNCAIHARLATPLAVDGGVPVLPLLGPSVELLTLSRSLVVTARVPARIDCRGPPAC